MRSTTDLNFLLVGSKTRGGTFYVCQPGPDRNIWMAYDMEPGGALSNPRIVFGSESAANWRGMPEFT